MFGYIIYKNMPHYSLEQKLQISLEGAEIVWPAEAVEFEEFTLLTEPDALSILIFRKNVEKVSSSISSQYIPRKLDGKELLKLVRKEEQIKF